MSPSINKAKAATPTRDAEATKNRILDAAEEEFARGGLLGARTEAIASGTGVTKAMLYYYFEDKEGLYQAMLERAFARRISALQKVDFSAPPKEALHAVLYALLDQVGTNKNLPAIFFYEGIQNKGRFYGKIAIASLYKPVVDILQRGMETGAFRSNMDPLHNAVNIIGACVFYYCSFENVKHLWPAGTDLLSTEMVETHKQQVVELAVNGVLNR